MVQTPAIQVTSLVVEDGKEVEWSKISNLTDPGVVVNPVTSCLDSDTTTLAATTTRVMKYLKTKKPGTMNLTAFAGQTYNKLIDQIGYKPLLGVLSIKQGMADLELMRGQAQYLRPVYVANDSDATAVCSLVALIAMILCKAESNACVQGESWLMNLVGAACDLPAPTTAKWSMADHHMYAGHSDTNGWDFLKHHKNQLHPDVEALITGHVDHSVTLQYAQDAVKKIPGQPMNGIVGNLHIVGRVSDYLSAAGIKLGLAETFVTSGLRYSLAAREKKVRGDGLLGAVAYDGMSWLGKQRKRFCNRTTGTALSFIILICGVVEPIRTTIVETVGWLRTAANLWSFLLGIVSFLRKGMDGTTELLSGGWQNFKSKNFCAHAGPEALFWYYFWGTEPTKECPPHVELIEYIFPTIMWLSAICVTWTIVKVVLFSILKPIAVLCVARISYKTRPNGTAQATVYDGKYFRLPRWMAWNVPDVDDVSGIPPPESPGDDVLQRADRQDLPGGSDGVRAQAPTTAGYSEAEPTGRTELTSTSTSSTGATTAVTRFKVEDSNVLITDPSRQNHDCMAPLETNSWVDLSDISEITAADVKKEGFSLVSTLRKKFPSVVLASWCLTHLTKPTGGDIDDSDIPDYIHDLDPTFQTYGEKPPHFTAAQKSGKSAMTTSSFITWMGNLVRPDSVIRKGAKTSFDHVHDCILPPLALFFTRQDVSVESFYGQNADEMVKMLTAYFYFGLSFSILNSPSGPKYVLKLVVNHRARATADYLVTFFKAYILSTTQSELEKYIDPFNFFSWFRLFQLVLTGVDKRDMWSTARWAIINRVKNVFGIPVGSKQPWQAELSERLQKFESECDQRNIRPMALLSVKFLMWILEPVFTGCNISDNHKANLKTRLTQRQAVLDSCEVSGKNAMPVVLGFMQLKDDKMVSVGPDWYQKSKNDGAGGPRR